MSGVGEHVEVWPVKPELDGGELNDLGECLLWDMGWGVSTVLAHG